MIFCSDLNDLCVLASLREIIIVRDNTYPVAYEYDTLGRMVAMATTRDNEVDFAALAVELANGASLTSLGAAWSLDLTQWHYDAATGLLTQKLYADGKGTAYTYTPEGKLASRTWARGVTTTYNYDAAGNLVVINYSDNTPNVSFSYDRLGRQLSAIVDGVSTTLYTYDHETLMLAMENQNGMLINRASDTFGRPVGFTLFPLHLGEGQGEGKPQYSVAYGYDEFGRFASVSSSASLANLAVQYSFHPGTDIIAGYTSGDFTRSISYEPARSMITSVENKFGDSIISRYDYTNDELGRRTAIARSGAAFGDTPVTDSYGYNLRSEVTSARRTLSADPEQAVHGFTHDYAYDPIGNRIVATNNQEAIVYVANSLNQCTAVNETEPIYDDDGNLLSDGRFNYTWNGENRLVMASNNMHVIKYAYDHQGRMVWKQIADSNSATKTITYTWDDFNIVAETICTPQSTIRNYNIWGLDLSQTLQGAGGVGGLLAVISPLPLGEGQGEGSLALACYDANGNITEYVDTNGTVVAHYEYSPFGEIAFQSGSIASTFTHRFSTKPWCVTTALSEYEYRKYSPNLGRWLSRDPIGEWGGVGLYGFVGNNTIAKIDVNGLIVMFPPIPIIISPIPSLPSPIEQPPVNPVKQPHCGTADVTDAFYEVLRDVQFTFYASWNKAKRDQKCCNLRRAITVKGFDLWINWDILRLADIGKNDSYPKSAIRGSSYPVIGTRPEDGSPEGLCERTVIISGNCYYAGTANYALFGRMFNLCYEHTKDPIFSASNAKRKATLWKHVTSGKRLIPAVKAFIDVGYDVSASIPNAAQSACGACKIIKKDKVDLWRPGGRWVWESDGG